MLRKLSLLGALAVVLATIAFAANAPTYRNPAGTEQDAQGVVVVNPDGSLATVGSGAGGGLSESDFDSKTGALTETAPATDTASSALNGRLQRVAQKLTSLITAVSNTIVLQAGGNIVGKVGIDQTTNGTTNRVNISTDGSVTPLASENHVGEVGSNQITITVAQTVTASSAYTAGNAVGGLITFANAARVSGASGNAGTSGLVLSAIVNAKSAQTTQMDLVVFNANPSGSTCTDKSAISVAAADFDKVLGVAHVVDWTALGTPSAGQAQNLAMPYALSSATSLYGCLVTRSTPTFAATTDISVSLRVVRN